MYLVNDDRFEEKFNEYNEIKYKMMRWEFVFFSFVGSDVGGQTKRQKNNNKKMTVLPVSLVLSGDFILSHILFPHHRFHAICQKTRI